MFNLRDALRGEANLQRVAFAADALRYETKIPTHHFVTVIKPLLGSDAFIFTWARDSFDERLCAAMMSFVDQDGTRLGARVLEKGIVIAEGFHHDAYGFDSVILFGPAHHGMYETVDAWLNAHAIEMFPIYRCEFVGDETPDDAAVIRRYGAPVMVWNRDAFPLVYLRWRNYVTGGGTIGNDWVHQELRVLLSELVKLLRDPKGWIECQNYRRETCRIVVRDGSYIVECSEESAPLSVDPGKIEMWATVFVTRGLGSA